MTDDNPTTADVATPEAWATVTIPLGGEMYDMLGCDHETYCDVADALKSELLADGHDVRSLTVGTDRISLIFRCDGLTQPQIMPLVVGCLLKVAAARLAELIVDEAVE